MIKYFDKILIFAIILLASCTSKDDNCGELFDLRLTVGFYEIIDNDSVYSVKAFSIDSITVSGQGNDSILYNNTKRVSSIKLPLKKFDTETSFEISFNDTIDIITISYTNNEPHFVSLECGCEVFHTIDTITTTHNYIDYVEVVNREININSQNAENIKIYRFR
jgi:hypothetical protein